MTVLKAHYEEKIQSLNAEATQLPEKVEVINKIHALKSSLVGGECANNDQLKEKRKRKKMAAEHRLSALTKAINSVEQTDTRDILQGHYTDIQQELKMKTDALKTISKKASYPIHIIISIKYPMFISSQHGLYFFVCFFIGLWFGT